jgi:hypothetical protein
MSFEYEEDDELIPAEVEELTLAERRAAVQDVVTPFDLDERDGVDGMLGAQITRWRDMPEGDAPAAWDQLRDFVDWVAERYDLSSTLVPACWYRHSVVVEELSALRAAWDASFVVETDGGLGPIGWHERFALARARLREYGYSGECERAGHIETPVRVVAVDEHDWNTWRKTA